MNPVSTQVLRLALAAAVAGASLGASANGQGGRDEGRDQGRDLSSDWWQWAVSIPAAVNPVLDASGQSCMVGQSGEVWFLAGSFGGVASRSCSVPEGVKLFLPVANSVNFDTPGVCGQVGNLSVAELRGFSATFINGLTQTSATIDSKPVRLRRIRSDVFPLALPTENIFTAPPDCVVPAGVYPRAVDDGYYALIDDLAVGEHTLQIAAAGANEFNLNVVYRLTVVRRDHR
jgi:hypothetical protein